MAGAETLLPLTLNLVRDGVITTGRAFELLATNPARLLGVNSGRLETGSEADLAVIDPDKPWIVDSSQMEASAGNTPFDRQPVQGRVLALFKGGAQVRRSNPDLRPESQSLRTAPGSGLLAAHRMHAPPRTLTFEHICRAELRSKPAAETR